VRRASSKSRLERDRDQATGIAALGVAVLIFLAGRRSRSNSDTTVSKDPPPKPDPPKRTWLEDVVHWLRKPVRKVDQEKQALEENPPPAPEPVADACKKSFGCITVSCGETTTAKAAEDAGETKDAAEETGGLGSIVVKALGAIAAGIGVTGAVVVVGAAIFWARFEAIGVPATQAVAAIPRTELLVLGGQEMIIFVLVALAATLLIALADPKGLITHGTLIVLGALVLGATIYAICAPLGWPWVLGLAALVLTFALVSIAIGLSTKQRLLPLLVSVFVLTFVFSASSAILIVEMQKYGQAIAIRFGPNADGKDRGLSGIYVTATDKTIFYARSDFDGQKVGLYEVPRGEATTYAVGPSEPVERDGAKPVEERGKALLKRLRGDAKSFPAPAPAPEVEVKPIPSE
jgi:hypothetical protein